MLRFTNPLIIAATSGSCQLVCDLLQIDNSSINHRVDVHGNTLLHLAASRGEVDICRALIRNGASRLKRNNANNTAIMNTVISGHFTAMIVINSPPIDFVEGQPNALFADMNHPTHMSLDGKTPLMMAAQEADGKMIETLIDNGFDRCATENISGETALMIAVCAGNRGGVSAMLRTSPDNMDRDHILIRCTKGKTALHHAMTQVGLTSNERILITGELIIARGKDLINMINNKYNTAFHIAVNLRHPIRILNLLIEGGADPMVDSGDHICPLFKAIHIRSSNTTAVQTLLTRGEPVYVGFPYSGGAPWFGLLNSRDRWNRTPLLAAIEYENFHVVEFMINQGADLQAYCSISGNTALHWAAGKGRISLCGLIIKRGGFNGRKNIHGHTPLQSVGLIANEIDSDPEDEEEMKQVNPVACETLLQETAVIATEKNLAFFMALHKRLGESCSTKQISTDSLRYILELAHGYGA